MEKTNKILRAWHCTLIKAMQIAVELQNDLEGFLYTTLDIFAEQLGKDNLMETNHQEYQVLRLLHNNHYYEGTASFKGTTCFLILNTKNMRT